MTEYKSAKTIKKIVISLLVLLLGGAITFYKERMLFLDDAFILFQIINGGSLQIQEHRYGSFITQMMPLLGLKLHLPLRALMIIYSCSFNLFFLTIGTLLITKYKRYDLGILFVFYLTIFVSDTYFWTNNEVHQGIAWLFISFAIVMQSAFKKKSPWQTGMLMIIFYSLAIWTHPLVLIVAIFLWGFHLIRKEDWPFNTKESIGYTILLLFVAATKFYVSSNQGYDSGKMESFENFNFWHAYEVVNFPQAKFILKNCVTHYWLFSLLTLAGLWILAWQRKYLLLAWTFIFTGGYFLLVCITYKNQTGLRFYMESEYMPVAIIALSPFVYYALPKMSARNVGFLLLLIFTVRIAYILHSRSLFVDRVNLISNIVDKMNTNKYNKLIVSNTDKRLEDALIMSWGLPVETVFISTLKHDEPVKTVVVLDSVKMKEVLNAPNFVFESCFGPMNNSNLDRNYFILDTLSPYRVVDYEFLLK